MTNPEILEWIQTAPGVPMNLDGSWGYQCVDLADSYAQAIFGVPWPQSMGAVEGAKQLLDAGPDAFWVRTDNDPGNPNQIPAPGDLVVWAGDHLNPWGHVAVVESADRDGMWVIQQDGFAPPLQYVNGGWYSAKPAHRARLKYSQPGTGPLKGWLTPRANKIVNYKAPAPKPAPAPSPSTKAAPHQRVVGSGGVNYRETPSSTGKHLKTFSPGDVLDFSGYRHAEKIDGIDLWFRGAHTGGWAWAGGFTQQNGAGLPDLTPKPPAATGLKPDQRKIIIGKANQRTAPNLSAPIAATLEKDFIFSVRGFVYGESYSGISVWYVGKNSGQYVWAGACNSQSVAGLTNLTPSKPVEAPVAAPKPSPATPAPVDLSKVLEGNTPKGGMIGDLPCVTEFISAHPDNFEVGNFPTKPGAYVPHQFGRLGVDTFESSRNWFLMGDADRNRDKKPGEARRGPSSAHFLVSGDKCLQMVLLKNRAYGSGKNGNDFVQIEVDPAMDEKTIRTLRTLIQQLNDFYGYDVATLVLHKDIPGNATACGTDVRLDLLQGIGRTVAPKPVPVKNEKDEILKALRDVVLRIEKL